MPLSWGRVSLAGPAAPAIHRGQHLCSQTLSEGDTAHDATNLFCRGRNPSLQGIVEGVIAHGELQETVLTCCLISRWGFFRIFEKTVHHDE